MRRDESRQYDGRDEKPPGAPQISNAKSTVRYRRPTALPSRSLSRSFCLSPPPLVIQNRGQHKHTNQCLISFTKGMLTLLKGH